MSSTSSTALTENSSRASNRLWSSRMAFILAASGSAVGLGNIWKFPYITGENGGGAFVLAYLLCIAVIGIPVMMAEVMIGRMGGQSPIDSMASVARREGAASRWKWLGWLGVAAAFIILSFYSVIGGWAVSYVGSAVSGQFVDAEASAIGDIFSSLLGDPATLLLWHSVFMVLVIGVVAKGLNAGIEKAVSSLMPALFFLLLVMVGYAMSTDHFSDALVFMFKPDFSKLTTEGFLTALGHAFFTLSLGMGVMMAYGSYLPKTVSIAKTSFIVAIVDTLVALLAGLAIFPIVMANGLEPGAGPGLIFQTLPLAFGQMPAGSLFSTLFFVLLVFAAWTSAISALEPTVQWLEENIFKNRLQSALVAGLTVWFLGIATVLSFNEWADFAPLSFISMFEGKTIFDLLDFLTANIMLPLGGLFVAIFVGWKMSRSGSAEGLQMNENTGFMLWRFLLRYVTPIAIAIVFVYNLL